jgi:hypothetical protein
VLVPPRRYEGVRGPLLPVIQLSWRHVTCFFLQVSGVSVHREKIRVPLPQHLLQRVQDTRYGFGYDSCFIRSNSISGAWEIDDGVSNEASIPVFQFDGDVRQQAATQRPNQTTVVIAVGIVRGHVGHFSHFLVDYVSFCHAPASCSPINVTVASGCSRSTRAARISRTRFRWRQQRDQRVCSVRYLYT